MEYVQVEGQQTESDYPYLAKNGACTHKKSDSVVYTTQTNCVEPHSPSQLRAALMQGPVGVSVDASEAVFQGYQSGVMNSTKCGVDTDHAIVAVGFGFEDGQDFYIVRNSWGAGWGDQGYIKIAAVDGIGICAIQKSPSWASAQ